MAYPPLEIGLNIDQVTDYSTDMIYADAARSGRGWLDPRVYNNDGKTYALIATDSLGNPLADCAMNLSEGLAGSDGTYHCRLTGYAQVGYAYNYGSIQPAPGVAAQYNAATNTTEFLAVSTPGQQNVMLTFTNTRQTGGPNGNGPPGFSNFQAMRPTTAGSTTTYNFGDWFNQTFITGIKPAQSIRYMDFLWINNQTAPTLDWPARTAPNYRLQACPGGACYEDAIRFANATNTNAWLNIPDMATANYKTQLALLVKYGSDINGNPYTSVQANPVNPPLKAGLKVYIETGNERWNSSFTVYGRDQARFTALPSNSPAKYDNAGGQERIGVMDCVETSNCFRAVFGDAAMGTTVKVVLGLQYDLTADYVSPSLSFLSGYYNNGSGNNVTAPHPPSYYIAAVCIAGYRQLNNVQVAGDQTVINTMYASGLEPMGTARLVAAAQSFGVDTYNYESSFSPGDAGVNAFLTQVNDDPQAGPATTQTIKDAANAGISVYMHYDTNRGNWAWWRSNTDLTHPKYLAIAALSPITGTAYMGTPTAPDIGTQSIGNTAGTSAAQQIVYNGQFNFPTAGKLSIRTQGYQLGSGQTIAVLIDGVQATTGRLPNPTTDFIDYGKNIMEVAVPAGVHAIVIQMLGPAVFLSGSTIDLAWPSVANLAPTVLDSSDFVTGIADGADIATDPGWTYTGQATRFVSDHALGGAHSQTGNFGICIISYVRTALPPSANYGVRATIDVKNDGYKRYISVRAPAGAGSFGGYNFGTDYNALVLEGPGGQISTNLPPLSIDGTGQYQLGLEVTGSTLSCFVNGYLVAVVQDTQLTAAGQGGFGIICSEQATAAQATKLSSFEVYSLDVANPTVTAVVVAPSTATVAGGGTQVFTATVSGTDNPSQSVTWSVSPSTATIAPSGTLTVPAATTLAQTFTVTATSTYDATHSGSATATVAASTGTVVDIITQSADRLTAALGDLVTAREIMAKVATPGATTLSLNARNYLTTALADKAAAQEVIAAIQSGGTVSVSKRTERIVRIALA